MASPQPVVEEFDRGERDEGIENRSRPVGEATLEFIEAHFRLDDTTGQIVALVGFDYRHRDVVQELHSTQHEYQDVILSASHTYQGEWCLESLFCRGSAERVRELTYRLRDFDGVRRVKVVVIRDSEL